ncbi:MAG: ECF-type riboflavin transporter substrate-binding protein [Acetatifactor sp.]
MKKLSVKSVVAIGIGAALFFVLGKISIPTPVPNTYISLQYAIQGVFATLFGPIAGLLIGFIGHTLIDVTSYGPWWSWIIASAFAGLVIGLITLKLDINEGLDKKKVIRFNVAQIIAHVLAWGLVAPVLDIVIYAEPVEKLFAQGLMAAVANIITTGVVGSLLLLAYAKTIVKKGSLSKED